MASSSTCPRRHYQSSQLAAVVITDQSVSSSKPTPSSPANSTWRTLLHPLGLVKRDTALHNQMECIRLWPYDDFDLSTLNVLPVAPSAQHVPPKPHSSRPSHLSASSLALQMLGQPRAAACSETLQWHDRQSIIVGCQHQLRTATNNSCVQPEKG